MVKREHQEPLRKRNSFFVDVGVQACEKTLLKWQDKNSGFRVTKPLQVEKWHRDPRPGSL